jgi:hypothetical protein
MSKLLNAVSFKANEVEVSLQSNLIAVSDDKAIALQKNMINRLKVNAIFCKTSIEVLTIIVNASSEQALEYLLDAKNYKTAQRILDVAKYLNNDAKYSSIIDYAIASINKLTSKDQNVSASIERIMIDTTQCYSRISNAVKALAFFKIISVDTSIDEKTMIINKLSKDTRLMIN